MSSGSVPVNVPREGPLTTAKSKGSSSGSDPVRVIATDVSSAVVTAWSIATGAELTVTVIVKDWGSSPSSFVATMVTPKSPSASGVHTISPVSSSMVMRVGELVRA